MVAALAVTLAGAGLQAGAFAAAEGTGTTCPTTTTETTTTTGSTATCTPADTTSTGTSNQAPPDPGPAPPSGVQATSEWQPASQSGATPDSGSQPTLQNTPPADSQTAGQHSNTGVASVSSGELVHLPGAAGAHPGQGLSPDGRRGGSHRRGRLLTVAARARAKAKARARALANGMPADQVYFPSVSIDWAVLTPLAPPPFPGTAAATFPGPYFLLPIYQAAATQYGVPWQVLASINQVETNWGQNMGPSSAGAIGWMQFLPSTWRTYGVDANGDGIANPEDPVDAIFSAAHYLKAAGAGSDLGRSIFAYNHSNRYVDQVVQQAILLGSIPADLLTTLTEKGRGEADAIKRVTGSKGLLDPGARINSVGRAMLLGNRALIRHILKDENISIYSCGREDIAAGIVDRRVLEVLQYLAARKLHPTVTALRCGHGFYTRSGNISEHSSGDAVDITAINGTPILGHQGPGSITETTIEQLLKLGGGMKPHQIISLMTFQGADNTFSMGDHANHIHIGYAAKRGIIGL